MARPGTIAQVDFFAESAASDAEWRVLSSFCPPGATAVIDLTADRLTLRRVTRHSGEFRLGPPLAEFALAGP